MGAYENLFSCPYGDTKSYVLDGMHQLLQECGKHIGGAWPSLLAQLKSVPLESEGPQTNLAHACLKTISDTLMDNVPVDCLQLYLTALGALGQQDTETEASMDAMGLLVAASKFLRARRARVAEAMSELSKGQSQGRDTGEAATRQLWVTVVVELQTLGLDRRNKVRDVAVQHLLEVLEQAVEEYGEAMVVLLLLQQVMPGVEEVAKRAREAAQQGALNTAQWLATWAQMMGGVAALLLKTLVPALVSGKTVQEELEPEDGGDGEGERELMTRLWQRFLELYAAVSTLQDDRSLSETVAKVSGLMIECPIPVSCWSSFWDANEKMIATCTADGVVASKTLLEVLGSLVTMQASPRVREQGVVSQEAVAGQLRALAQVMTRQRRRSARSGHQAAEENQQELHSMLATVLRALVKSFALFAPDAELLLWQETLALLLSHIPVPAAPQRPAWAVPACARALPAVADPQAKAPQLAVWLLQQLYCEEANERIRGLLFEPLVLWLLEAMCARTAGQPKHVWQCVAEALDRVIEHALLPMVSHADLAPADKAAVWKRMLEGMKAFLVPVVSEELATVAVVRGEYLGCVARWKAPEWEDFDVALARTVSLVMLPLATDKEIQSQAVLLLDGVIGDGCQGNYDDDVGRAVLTGTCLDGLMAAAANWGQSGSKSEHGVDVPQLFLAKSAATVAIERCRDVVEKYLEGEEAPENRGRGPAATRAELAVSALSMLETLTLSPEVFAYLCEKLSDGDTSKALNSVRPKNTLKDRRERIAAMVANGNPKAAKRGHMVLLFSTLCRCITSHEEELRQGARRMLQYAASDIGIAEFV